MGVKETANIEKLKVVAGEVYQPVKKNCTASWIVALLKVGYSWHGGQGLELFWMSRVWILEVFIKNQSRGWKKSTFWLGNILARVKTI